MTICNEQTKTIRVKNREGKEKQKQEGGNKRAMTSSKKIK